MGLKKRFTFADGYGLGLIATDPHGDWTGIVERLSEPAQRIANAIINPDSASRDAKSAAKKLLNRADKHDNNDQP